MVRGGYVVKLYLARPEDEEIPRSRMRRWVSRTPILRRFLENEERRHDFVCTTLTYHLSPTNKPGAKWAFYTRSIVRPASIMETGAFTSGLAYAGHVSVPISMYGITSLLRRDFELGALLRPVSEPKAVDAEAAGSVRLPPKRRPDLRMHLQPRIRQLRHTSYSYVTHSCICMPADNPSGWSLSTHF